MPNTGGQIVGGVGSDNSRYSLPLTAGGSAVIVSANGSTVAATVTIADGADVAEGSTSDVAVVGDVSGSISAKLRGISKILNSVWSATNTLAVSVAEKTCLTVTGSISSNTAIVALVASKRIKVVAISMRTAYSGGTITPILTDGNGGTTIWEDLEQALSGSVSGHVATIGGPYWLCATSAGNALYLNPNGQTVVYSITYFADDAT